MYTIAPEPVSVIIPACNEEGSLPGCLRSLLGQSGCGRMAVAVVANGCSDRTAEVARGWQDRFEAAGHSLVVVELPAGCKPRALDAGDAAVGAGGVRVYLDADVLLSRRAIARVADALRPGGGIHLATPRLRVAPALSGVTRCYGRVWARLPYIRRDVIGCGFYAVSEEGRKRWTTFPRIISDDKFVRLHFGRHERVVIQRASFTIRLPEGAAELMRVRGRWCRGNHELRGHFPRLAQRDRGRYLHAAAYLLSHPETWAHVPLFLMVYAAGELLAVWKAGVGTSEWERADGARALLPGVLQGAETSLANVPRVAPRRMPQAAVAGARVITGRAKIVPGAAQVS